MQPLKNYIFTSLINPRLVLKVVVSLFCWREQGGWLEFTFDLWRRQQRIQWDRKRKPLHCNWRKLPGRVDLQPHLHLWPACRQLSQLKIVTKLTHFGRQGELCRQDRPQRRKSLWLWAQCCSRCCCNNCSANHASVSQVFFSVRYLLYVYSEYLAVVLVQLT